MRNWWWKTIAAFLFFLLLFSLTGGKKKESFVEAATLAAYSGNCLGGWDNPKNASGLPNILDSNNPASFNENNSAILNKKAAQIFCGSFDSENKSQPPSKVSLKLSWNIIFSDQSPISSTTDTDSVIWNNVISSSTTPEFSSSTPTSTPSDIPPNPTSTIPNVFQASSTESNQLPPPATATNPAQPDASSTSPAIPTPVNEIQPAEQSEQPANTTSTTSFFNFLIKRAFAQSTDSNQQNFLQITYSTDGKDWNTLSYINELNWKDFSADIPVNSWDDIGKLQVQIAPVTALDMPAIYLDSVWLEISYDQSIIDSFKEGADVVLDVASDVGDMVNDVINTATDEIKQIVDDALNSDEAEKTETAPQDTRSETKTPKFSFAIKRSLSTETKDLPWFPTDPKKQRKNTGSVGSADVTATSDQNSFKVEGACGDVFYTVLLFRNGDDYLNDPSSAVLNRAYPCENGSFSQVFSARDFPNIPDGTYFLLTADQGTQGPWKPNAAIREITVAKQIQ